MQDGAARLGLVIAKRQIRRAHERNRIKRLVRESFRQLPARERAALDIIVIARHAAEEHENATIARALARHWQRLFPEK